MESAQMKRIVLVDNFSGAFPGGGERYITDIVSALRCQGYEIVIVAAQASGFSHAMQEAGYPVLELGFRVRESISDAALIREAIQDQLGEEPVILQGSGFYASWLCAQAATDADIVIGTVQSEPDPPVGAIKGTLKKAARGWMRNLTLSRLDHVITVSGELAPQLEALGYGSRVAVIRPKVEVADLRERVFAIRSRSHRADHVTIGYLGRLESVKGVDLLVEALGLLAKEGGTRPWRAIIAGSGSLSRQLEVCAQREGISDLVQFTGHVAPEEVLAQADVLVAPSRAEGLNLAVLEAKAASVLVVATTVGGMGPSVIGGRGVVITDSTAEAVAASLKTALESVGTPEAQVMTLSARQRVETEFSPERFFQEVQAFYSGLDQSSS